MELKGVLLSQPWGMLGLHGLAAQLYSSGEERNSIHAEIPYGEYIVGGDKFNQTYVVSKDEYIIPFFKQLTAQELGETAYCEFGDNLPFSIKIMSVGTPAPLLCYPCMEKGNRYHEQNAKEFLTSGVRHEMVIALKKCSFLVGFRSLDYILQVLEKVPEFRIMVDEQLINNFLHSRTKKDFLKIFKELLDNLPSQVEYAGKILKDKLLNSPPSGLGDFHPMKLFLKLVADYPCDVGIFLPYFLNEVKLKRLEAMIIPAETPYTYLYGEAIEFSNTVENGTTAAFCARRDLDRFCNSLGLRFWSVKVMMNELAVEIRSADTYIQEYLTSSPYYRVFVGAVMDTQDLPRLSSFSIVMIIEGEGDINDHLQFVPGSAFLFFRREKITINAKEKVMFVQVAINVLI